MTPLERAPESSDFASFANLCKLLLANRTRLFQIPPIGRQSEAITIPSDQIAMNSLASKKITAATFKSFVRKNRAALQLAVTSSFDGMTDCVEARSGKFTPAQAHQDEGTDWDRRTCGIRGVWLVGQSRDYFEFYSKDGMEGIRVSNSCGSFIVAIPAAPTPRRRAITLAR